MATTSLDQTSLPKKNYTVTSSFLNQLQTEWNEFLLEVSHSTPVVNLNITAASVGFLPDDIRKSFITSKNESIHSFGDNLVIPVPLNILKRLLSPTKFQGDEASKIEIFNTIRKDPHLTSDASQKLRKLLFPNSETYAEISDWPSPDKNRYLRHSAPLRICPTKQRAAFKLVVGDNKAKEPVSGKEKPILNILESDVNDAITKKPVQTKREDRLRDEFKGKNAKWDERKEQQYSSVYNLGVSSNSTSLFYDVMKHSQNGKNCRPTMVFTYFGQVELTKMYQIVKKLGYFRIENNVTSRTTHLICGTSKKTMNLCKAVVRGCWILDKNWIFTSENENRWLLEERFELSHLWPAIKLVNDGENLKIGYPNLVPKLIRRSVNSGKKNRLKREEYGMSYRCDIFKDVGSIHVSKSCTQPTTDDLEEVITLAGGNLTNSMHKTAIVIGSIPKQKYVREVWVLNCILRGVLIDTDKYFRGDVQKPKTDEISEFSSPSHLTSVKLHY